jgi:hypothetical protein
VYRCHRRLGVKPLEKNSRESGDFIPSSQFHKSHYYRTVPLNCNRELDLHVPDELRSVHAFEHGGGEGGGGALVCDMLVCECVCLCRALPTSLPCHDVSTRGQPRQWDSYFHVFAFSVMRNPLIPAETAPLTIYSRNKWTGLFIAPPTLRRAL